jgi:hypothetical protein
MPKHGTNVICIQRDIAISDADQQVVDLAFNLWFSSAFRSSPHKALLIAVQMLRKKSANLFLVPKCKSNLRSLTEIRHIQEAGDNEDTPCA